MFMSTVDLEALTGYRRKSAQVRWLTDRGFKFELRADGSPAVLVAQLEARQAVRSTVRGAKQPDFSSLTG